MSDLVSPKMVNPISAVGLDSPCIQCLTSCAQSSLSIALGRIAERYLLLLIGYGSGEDAKVCRISLIEEKRARPHTESFR